MSLQVETQPSERRSRGTASAEAAGDTTLGIPFSPMMGACDSSGLQTNKPTIAAPMSLPLDQGSVSNAFKGSTALRSSART